MCINHVLLYGTLVGFWCVQTSWPEESISLMSTGSYNTTPQVMPGKGLQFTKGLFVMTKIFPFQLYVINEQVVVRHHLPRMPTSRLQTLGSEPRTFTTSISYPEKV
jgi:hypothetical protein